MRETSHDLNQPLDALMALATKKFHGVHFETVNMGGVNLEVLQITDMPRYIDTLVGRARPGESVDLPLWAKIWPACMVLGLFLGNYPFKKDASILEVGAGGAVNGLMLASQGKRVTVSDIEDDALLLARINALKNGLGDRVEILKVDMTKDDMGRQFDYIVGCEVLYAEATYVPVADFLDVHLASKPDAEILLALDSKRLAKTFFGHMSNTFSMMKSSVSYRKTDECEKSLVNLFRLRRSGA